MAITFYTGQDEQYGLAEQAAWGDTPATNVAAQGIHIAEWDLKPMVTFVEPNRAKAQRYHYTTDLTAHEKGAVHEITLPATPALKDQIDKFIYGVVQNVSEGTATPYTKTFTFPQTQPDFSADAGYFFTLVNKMPVASTSHYVNDCIVSQLTLSCAPGANDGMLAVEATMMGLAQGETLNYSGTITYPDVAVGTDFFFFHDLATKTVAGTDVVLGTDGIKIVISNNAVPVGGSGGKPETFGLTGYTVQTTVNALWDSTLRTSMASMRSGTAEALVFSWGTPGSDGALSITVNGKWREPRDLSHAKEGEFVTLTHEAAGVYGATEPLSIVISNAIDRTW